MKVAFATILLSAVLLSANSGMSAPPAELLGQYLYFEEGPEDYLAFDDATTGEKRDLTDVDPFTYTYAVTGKKADIVVTFDAGEYDEWELTYDGPGKGSFVRREFKASSLEDTDTGRFSESTGGAEPPISLIGVRLEEAVELEDERFEFLTDTEGREFEPGDVDRFTYVYEVIDETSASIVASFRADKYDDLALDFASETTGTYQLSRYDDGLLKDQKRGAFRLDLNTQTVDVLIGGTKGRLKGDDFFNPAGRQQTQQVKLTGTRPAKIETEVENDGDDDSIEVRAGKVSKKYIVNHFTLKPRRNVTGALMRGKLNLGAIGHSESEKIETEIRSRTGGGGKSEGMIEGRSRKIEGARDRAKFTITAK